MKTPICKSISIIIPNWNGRALLEKFLPALTTATNNYKGDSEIIVVDDASNDDSITFLKTHFPFIKTLELHENKGFSVACNSGLSHCSKELVLFLNNDMSVSKDFLKPLSRHFQDKNVFGVRLGIKWLTEEGIKTDLSRFFLGLDFKNGLIECPMLRLKKELKPFYCSTASGGAGIFDRKKLMRLHGFDEIFSPFYWEDFDLSYRAWKRGWKLIFEPESVVYHQHSSTIGRFKDRKFVLKISTRNRYLVVWKNINDLSYIFKHLLFIPIRISGHLFKNNPVEISAFLEALKLLPVIMKNRRIEKSERIVRDREIFRFFKKIAQDTDPFYE